MKLNNKGFAITAVLYGLLILFVFLVGSYLTVLTAKKNRVDKMTSEVEKVVVASEYISDLFSKTGTVTNNGITYDIDENNSLIDTSIMYKDLGNNVIVYRGDIDCDGVVTNDESVYILNYTFFGNAEYPLNESIADVNGDGIITDADATYAQNIAKGSVAKVVVSIPKTSYNASNCILDKNINQEIRYYGKNPKNYVDIGDNEEWRIIGLFDGKLKLARKKSIGAYSWDSSANTSTTNNGSGINEWSQADLMKLLNPGYTGTGGSLWYNHTDGTCYNNSNNSTVSCDFTNTGLSDSVKNKIVDVTWNLGGGSSGDVYPNQIYEFERGTSVIVNPSDGIPRSTSWTGKIALPYLSDYGYATDFLICSSQLSKYNEGDNSSICRNNNWMFSILATGNAGLLLNTVTSSYPYSLYRLYIYGQANSNGYASSSGNVVPVLYLDSKLLLKGGNGTSSDPYVIG